MKRLIYSVIAIICIGSAMYAQETVKPKLTSEQLLKAEQYKSALLELDNNILKFQNYVAEQRAKLQKDGAALNLELCGVQIFDFKTSRCVAVPDTKVEKP